MSDEFLTRTIYICQVVLTNPTSSEQKVDLLLQIPRGAVAVNNGFATHGLPGRLASFSTHTVEYGFYFLAPESFPHYPALVAKNEQFATAATASNLEVVSRLSRVDTGSWAHVSQHGGEEEVLGFLEGVNIERLDLDKIAWRMRDKAIYDRTPAILAARHVYLHTLWSYSLFHDDANHLSHYLARNEDFLQNCGLWLESPLISIDPVRRCWYEHLEYAPLVNARSHRPGARYVILNDRFAEQYARTSSMLRYKPRLGSDDRLALAYYLFLQDRVAEGLAMLRKVDRDSVATIIQYDYLRAYADFYEGDLASARRIAAGYEHYAVVRWRDLFRGILAHLDELEGKQPGIADEKDREQLYERMAASEAVFEFTVEDKAINLHYQNLSECLVSYYLMDVELRRRCPVL